MNDKLIKEIANLLTYKFNLNKEDKEDLIAEGYSIVREADKSFDESKGEYNKWIKLNLYGKLKNWVYKYRLREVIMDEDILYNIQNGYDNPLFIDYIDLLNKFNTLEKAIFLYTVVNKNSSWKGFCIKYKIFINEITFYNMKNNIEKLFYKGEF